MAHAVSGPLWAPHLKVQNNLFADFRRSGARNLGERNVWRALSFRSTLPLGGQFGLLGHQSRPRISARNENITTHVAKVAPKCPGQLPRPPREHDSSGITSPKSPMNSPGHLPRQPLYVDVVSTFGTGLSIRHTTPGFAFDT